MAQKRKRTTRMDERSAGVTRRMLLAASGALAVGAGVAAAVKYNQWWNLPPGAGHKALSQGEYDLVQALAEVWMPPGDEAPSLSGAQADCGGFVDEVVFRMPADQRKLFKLLLHVLDETPWPVELARFTQLDLQKRAAHLQAWLDSPIFYHRQGVSAVMALVAMGYTSHPEVAPVFAKWFGCGYGR